MKDKFGNYVIQKAVEVAVGEQRELFISKIHNIPDPNNYC
jgi:hypothetical protein